MGAYVVNIRSNDFKAKAEALNSASTRPPNSLISRFASGFIGSLRRALSSKIFIKIMGELRIAFGEVKRSLSRIISRPSIFAWIFTVFFLFGLSIYLNSYRNIKCCCFTSSIYSCSLLKNRSTGCWPSSLLKFKRPAIFI